jgi:hypothetical protein
MPAKLIWRQPERSVGRGDGIGGMIAKQDEAGIRAAGENAIAVVLFCTDSERRRGVVSNPRTIVPLAGRVERRCFA